MTASVHDGDCWNKVIPKTKENPSKAGYESPKCWGCSVCCLTNCAVNGVRHSKEYAMMGSEARDNKDTSGVVGKSSLKKGIRIGIKVGGKGNHTTSVLNR